MGKMTKQAKIAVVFFLVLAAAPVANALMVRLSLDGVNPAPETMDIVPGDVTAMYVISDSNGVGYWEELHAAYKDDLATISNVQSYPAAGDLADILIIEPSRVQVTADDSIDNILAGIHFSFDLTLAPDAILGDHWDLYMFNDPLADDAVVFNVVPEPATVLLLSLGGLALLKKRRV